MCAISTFVGVGSEIWDGNAVRNDFICCHKSLLPTIVPCRVLDEVELDETTRVDQRALAVSFDSFTFQIQIMKKARIRSSALPNVSHGGDMWRQEAFQQCLPWSVQQNTHIYEV